MSHHHHAPGPPSPAGEHRARGPRSVRCFALTISDTKTEADDASGELIRRLLTEGGHEVAGSKIVKDEPAEIRAAILGAILAGAQVVVSSGGTGLTSRDSTFEVVSALIERPIPGFGELFRALSFQEIGSAAMLSRAVAGVVKGAVVFALPGSPHGVKTALERLVVPELAHVFEQLGR
jgi:molybdopterin adenylyltransferase